MYLKFNFQTSSKTDAEAAAPIDTLMWSKNYVCSPKPVHQDRLKHVFRHRHFPAKGAGNETQGLMHAKPMLFY